MNQILVPSRLQAPPVIAAAGEKASYHFLEFFATQIVNEHTREAYVRAVREFCAWLEEKGAPSIASVSSVHVGAYFKILRDAHPRQAPYVKQRLAAVRSLLDWLAGKGVLAFNPASAVRGPKHVVKRGKTPVLAPDEARQLLDAIDVGTPIGLRDRALIGLMVYSFARIGAAVAMNVGDVFVQNRRLHVRLREKGGKDVALPCHHNLETYLHAYLNESGIAEDRDGPLFRTIGRGTSRLTRTALSRVNAWDMVRRRAVAAGIATDICNHTFRATGITAYLKNGGTLEKAATIANHASTRTTQLYDRRSDDVSLDEVERILI